MNAPHSEQSSQLSPDRNLRGALFLPAVARTPQLAFDAGSAIESRPARVPLTGQDAFPMLGHEEEA